MPTPLIDDPELGEEARELFQTAILGKDAADFFKTEIGQYVIGRAQIEIEQAKNDLVEANPYNEQDIMKLQSAIRTAQKAIRWLNDAIKAGEGAEHNIQTMIDGNE